MFIKITDISSCVVLLNSTHIIELGSNSKYDRFWITTTAIEHGVNSYYSISQIVYEKVKTELEDLR